MTKTKLYEGNIRHPEDSSIKFHFDTQTEFRPELWVVRKAILLLAEKHPTSSAVDMKLLVTGKPFHTENEWYDGYSTEIVTFLWQLYMYYLDRKLDKSDVILMWIIRNFHYYWLGGPKPSGIHKPRREYNPENKNEAFRKNLSCSACHQPFVYEFIDTDPRLVVMTRYNEWMYSHIQVCTVVHVDLSSVQRKAQAKLEFEKERKEKEELDLHRYEEWKLSQKEQLVRTPYIDVEQVEHDARVLRTLITIVKLYRKNLVLQGNLRLHALSQYCALQYDRHHIVTKENRRDKLQVLADAHGVLLIKYGKKFPKYGKFYTDEDKGYTTRK